MKAEQEQRRNVQRELARLAVQEGLNLCENQSDTARGLPCLVAWLWFMGALGWHFLGIRRRLKRGGYSTWMADAAFAGWLAFLIEGFFEFNFGTTPVLTVFLFVTSAPFAAERLTTSGQDKALEAA